MNSRAASGSSPTSGIATNRPPMPRGTTTNGVRWAATLPPATNGTRRLAWDALGGVGVDTWESLQPEIPTCPHPSWSTQDRDDLNLLGTKNCLDNRVQLNGGNVLDSGYANPRWGGYLQIQEAGGHVRKGEKAPRSCTSTGVSAAWLATTTATRHWMTRGDGTRMAQVRPAAR